MRIPATLAVLALLSASGCGSEDEAAAPPADKAASPSSDKVEIKDFKYGPETIQVKRGQTVDFTNEDTAKHTATSKPQGTFDSGDIAKGQTKPVKFEKAGSFRLYCVYHPTMAAKVEVAD